MTEIGELNIRVPGMSEDAGANLGRMVAEKVSAALSAGKNDRYIPELSIKIQGSVSENTDVMAERIAQQIIRQINI
jgi:hypothetical protein